MIRITTLFLLLTVAIPVKAHAAIWQEYCESLLRPGQPATIDPSLLAESPNDFLIAETQPHESVMLVARSQVDSVYTNWLQDVDRIISDSTAMPKLELARVLTKKVFDSFHNDQQEWGQPPDKESWFQSRWRNWRYQRITGENSEFNGIPVLNEVVRVRIGSLLAIRRAVCRHRSALLLAVFRRAGINAVMVSGNMSEHQNTEETNAGGGGGHAWVEAIIEGNRYLFDPMNLAHTALNGAIIEDEMLVTIRLNRLWSITLWRFGEKSRGSIRTIKPGEAVL